MNARQHQTELERRQREALFAQRAPLWQLAYDGFRAGGRGLITADGSEGRSTRPVAVRWRSGRDLLNGRGNQFGWVQETAGHLREYNQRTEFVLQYVSPEAAVHVYRLRAPAGARAPDNAGTAPAGERVRG